MNEFGPWERTEGLDEYTAGHGLVGQPAGCSFCGSMPPDDFMAAVKAGAEIGPTDKSYKFYVKWVNPEPDALYVIGSTNAEAKPVKGEWPGGGLDWYGWDELSAEQMEIVRRDDYDRDGYRPKFLGFGIRPNIDAKFYTPHLSPEQGREFFDLWQAGQVHWGYPGHPYRRLYLPGFEKKAVGES
jgi:hypothetical protein